MARLRLVVQAALISFIAGVSTQPVVISAPPDASPTPYRATAAVADPTVSRNADLFELQSMPKRIVRRPDGTTRELYRLPGTRHLVQAVPDESMPKSAPAEFSRVEPFQTLPNWAVGTPNAQFIPNYDEGMADFDLVAARAYPAGFLAIAKPLPVVPLPLLTVPLK